MNFYSFFRSANEKFSAPIWLRENLSSAPSAPMNFSSKVVTSGVVIQTFLPIMFEPPKYLLLGIMQSRVFYIYFL